MGLVISKGLTLRKGYIGTDDPDAEAYIAAVEAADLAADPTAEPLETATKVAIHSFVKGAKADGFWPAIKASCILAGARTLNGALVPLAGTAPTNFNFVDGDYNRKTGLVGDGSTKYLDSNRNNNADPQNSKHLAAYTTTVGTSGTPFLATGIASGRSFITSAAQIAINRQDFVASTAPVASTLIAASRANASSINYRVNGSTLLFSSNPSEAPFNQNIFVLRRLGAGILEYANHRIAFYSIGESLDLALLDARVTDLINAFGAAIP
jgi:hypothetical protein